MELYIFPKLPSRYDVGIRLIGSGLANCLLVYSRAEVLANKYQLPIINPTWQQFNVGPYLRKEKDKRHYLDLFKTIGESGIKKYYLLKTLQHYKESDIETILQSYERGKGIIRVEGLRNYFEEIIHDHQLVGKKIFENINPKYLHSIPNHKFESIGIHVRLGDYISELRADISWYVNCVKKINKAAGKNCNFMVFSDGTDQELKPLLELPNVKRVFFGSAISDILALSKCKLIIGSDSTFSAWASYLGQIPTIYPKKHFGRVLEIAEDETILKEEDSLSDRFVQFIQDNIHGKN